MRLLNVDILAEDVHVLAGFYNQVLGLPFALPYAREDGWAALRIGEVMLFLLPSDQAERDPKRSPGEGGRPGLDSLALEVEDLDSSIDELGESVTWAQSEPTRLEQPSGEVFRFRGLHDPEGNLIYLSEFTPSSRGN
ncbi:MAG: hypothetical protein J0H66_08370 [Solirubrobacterales bacterium]|nr:hypothetical protein [Solirubrobacterales bacterium]OJU95901.1 MAG: hypothetical protein BGO23_10005 [Solirubrobacterales bacterium 67-14]